MSNEIDDVRLTAYALGELDASEMVEIAALLASNPKARAEVDAIRSMAQALSAELGRDAVAPALTAAQKDAIAQAAHTAAPHLHARPNSGPASWYRRPWALAAATILVIVTAGSMWQWSRPAIPSDAARASASGEKVAELSRTEHEAAALERERAALKDQVYTTTAVPKLEATSEQRLGVAYTNVPAWTGDPVTGVLLGEQLKQIAEKPIAAMVAGQDRFDQDETSLSSESYSHFAENAFVRAAGDNARSTFALDVDTASYSNVRRLLRQGSRPDKGAIRTEELINYFEYDYPAPADGRPLGVTVEIAQCPWAPTHRLALIGLRAKTIDRSARGRANLVFLIDVSGSMSDGNKLPLVKRSLSMLIDQLRGDDRIALVVYAGASGLVLPSTSAGEKAPIREAIERLSAGGSTNGGAGIELAYSVARDNFVQGGINRVILCTDGDFNVGTTSESSLVEMIEGRAKTGVFLTVLGFGMGNLKDSTLQKLANKGNGAYGYIDTEAEAKKLLVNQVDATLVTVAKDARIQVEFNPALAGAWRLIGYEKRVMANRDFHDDTKDAGEVGSGHAVTALYEIIPAGSPELEKLPKVDPMKYQGSVTAGAGMAGSEMMTVSLRWKEPDGDKSALVEVPARDEGGATRVPSANFRWASAVAMFGMELRGSEHKGLTNWALIDELSREAKGEDRAGLRAEFLELVKIMRDRGER